MYWDNMRGIMENQMEKKMENEMDTFRQVVPGVVHASVRQKAPAHLFLDPPTLNNIRYLNPNSRQNNGFRVQGSRV